MYQLEDRILFDGAAVVDAAAAQQAFNEQQEAQAEAEAAHAEQNAAEAEANQEQSQEAGNPADDPAHALDQEAVQDFLSNSFADSVADEPVKVYISASDAPQLDALRAALGENDLLIEYDADATTKADLMRMLSETLNDRKADEIVFLDAEDSADAGIDGDADADDALARDFDADEFAGEVAEFLDADGEATFVEAGEELVIAGDADGDDGDDADDGADHVYDDADADDDYSAIADDDGTDLIDEYAAHLDVLNNAPETRTEIVFIDTRVNNYQQIVDAIDPSAHIVYIADGDALSQINDYLSQFDGEVDAIHFVTHGSEGFVRIGDQNIDADYLLTNREEFAAWSNALASHGDVMFYGCSIAAGDQGKALVNAIAAITGANVAASTNATGKGGDWTLEYRIGNVDTAAITVDGYEDYLAAARKFRTNADGDWEDAVWGRVEGDELVEGETYTWSDIQTMINQGLYDISVEVDKTITVNGNFDLDLNAVNSTSVTVLDQGVVDVNGSITIVGGEERGSFVVNSGGTLNINDGGTLTVRGTDGTGIDALQVNGAFNIAANGTMVMESGQATVNSSINGTVQPESEDDPRVPSRMRNLTGKLSQTGGEFHFRGAEMGTQVNQTGGTFYYDGAGEQAMAGGGSVYRDVVVSGGDKVLWGKATVEGDFTFVDDTDVRLSAYDSAGYPSVINGELEFAHTAQVILADGSFITEYEVVTGYDEDGNPSNWTTVQGGLLTFNLASTTSLLQVKVGVDTRARSEWSMLRLENANAIGMVTASIRAFWAGSHYPTGAETADSYMGFAVSGLSGGELGMYLVGYSKGAVSEDFSFATAAIYDASGRLNNDYSQNQFDMAVTANGTYHYQGTPIDARVLNVTTVDDMKIGSLRVAVDYANRFGGEITFSEEVNNFLIMINDFAITINGNVVISGSGVGRTFIVGDGNTQLFNILAGGSLTISDATLRNGVFENGSGGAIYNAGILDMSNVDIEDSKALNGGAIYGAAGSVSRLFNVEIDGAEALRNGGAFYVAAGALLSADRLEMSNVKAGEFGGAFYVAAGRGSLDEDGNPVKNTEGGSLELKNVDINGAQAENGAVIFTGNWDLIYTVIEEVDGGEIIIRRAVYFGGTVMLDSVTFSDAVALDADGAAVYVGGKVYGVNVTASGNNGVASVFEVGGGGASLTLENTTIAFNSGRTISNTNGGYLRLANALFDGSVNGNISYYENYSTAGASYLESQLKDNGGWVRTLALTRNITGSNNGETSSDARGYVYNEYIYTGSNSGVSVGRSLGAYQYLGAVAWSEGNSRHYADLNVAVADANSKELQLVGSRIIAQDVNISRDVILVGQGAGLTVLDARENGRIFQITYAGGDIQKVTLAGMTLTNGKAAYGGAIYTTQNLVLSNVRIQENSANRGGGIYVSGGNLVMYRTNFVDNESAYEGGAIYAESTASAATTVVADGSNFSYNHAGTDGGAVYLKSSGNYFATLSIQNSLLDHNVADRAGGAVFVQGHAELLTTTVAYNQSGDGSSLFFQNYNGSSQWYLTNVTVAWNSQLAGSLQAVTGALRVTGGELSLVNTLVALNNASWQTENGLLVLAATHDIYGLNSTGTGFDRGVVNAGFRQTNSVYQFRPNQFMGYANEDWQYDPSNRVSGNQLVAGDAIFDFFYQVSGEDRMMGRLADNGGWSRTLALMADEQERSVVYNGALVTVNHQSKLIDRGAEAAGSDADQRGYLVNGVRDIGAFEYKGFIGTVTVVSPAGVNMVIGITSLTELSGYTNFFSGTGNNAAGTGSAYKDISVELVNSRILDYNIDLNTVWVEAVTGGQTGGGRTITIYGAAEGGTVLDAAGRGSLITAQGSYFWAPGASDASFIMGNLVIERLTMTGAVGNYGSAVKTGGIVGDGGSITLNSVQIVDNISRLGGGGLYVRTAGEGGGEKEASYILNNSLISGNLTAGSGGGIYAGGSVSVNASTIAYNQAGGSGGGIAIIGGSVSLNGSTVSYNHATGTDGGGGVYNAGSLSASGSILAKNRTGSGYFGTSYSTGVPLGDYDYVLVGDSSLGDQSYNLVEIQNGVYSSAEGGNTNYFAPRGNIQYTHLSNGSFLGVTSDLFHTGRLADHGGWAQTIALGQRSSAKDGTEFTSGDDQRGYTWSGWSRDIGAYELNGTFITVNGRRFDNFYDALAFAGAGDTLVLNATRILAHDAEIQKSVSIVTAGGDRGDFLHRGSMTFIDAQHFGRVFNISNSRAEVSMAGLYLYSGLSMLSGTDTVSKAGGNGGAIYNAGTLTLTDVSVVGSYAQRNGGGIYSVKALTIDATNGYNMLESSYSYNRATLGGAIYSAGAFTITGEALYGGKSGTWSYSTSLQDRDGNTFDSVNLYPYYQRANYSAAHIGGNIASEGGAFYLASGSADLDGVHLFANQALSQGGAISGRNINLSVDISLVQDNLARGNGGAFNLAGGGLSMTDTGVFGNLAFGSGGAVYGLGLGEIILHTTPTGQTFSTSFDANMAIYGSGGAMYVDGFQLLHAYTNGSAVSVSFTGNSSVFGSGGALYLLNGQSVKFGHERTAQEELDGVTGNSVVFQDNTAGVDGRNSNQYVASVDAFGRALNDLKGTDYHGGAIFARNLLEMSMFMNVSLAENAAIGKGGGLYYQSGQSFRTGQNAQFLGNLAGNVGGGAYLENIVSINLDYTTIANNFAGIYSWAAGSANGYGSGGGFYIVSQSSQVGAPVIVMNDMDVYDNNNYNHASSRIASGSQGGAFYIDSANAAVTVTNSGFDGNFAGTGGAFYFAGQNGGGALKSIEFVNVSFGNNYGTAVHAGQVSGSFKMNYVTMAYNQAASGQTTGLHFDGFTAASGQKVFTISNSIFFETQAGAAPVYLASLAGATVTSRNNVYFRYNEFTGAGSAALTQGSLSTIQALSTDEYGNENWNLLSGQVRDGNGNLVGINNAGNQFIADNLYLSTQMLYHANYLTRAMALEAKNSIAYQYRYNGAIVRPGDLAGEGITTDQRGNFRTGLEVFTDKDGKVVYQFYVYENGVWSQVKVVEGSTEVITVATGVAPRSSIGAFEPNFYMVVTTNGDNTTNGVNWLQNSSSNWHDIYSAITGIARNGSVDADGGISLREAIYWIDTYALGSTTNSAGKFVFDPNRYVQFSDGMFEDGRNNIDLTSGQIVIDKDVVVGMVDGYGGYNFVADNTFRAQDDTSRITISGLNQSRIFYLRPQADYTALSGRGGLTTTATVGLNNLTLTNGYQGWETVTNSSGAWVTDSMTRGWGGAIMNYGGNLTLHNAVVKDSTATNDDFRDGESGSYAGIGGGIANYYGTVTIYDSTISNNTARADHLDETTTSAGFGGGIANIYGTLSIYRSAIVGNTAIGFGCDPELGHVHFVAEGGGIYSEGGRFTMVSTTVTENSISYSVLGSTYEGASAIMLNGGTNILIGNTIAYNNVYKYLNGTGWAVIINGGSNYLQNNIIANNYVDGFATQESKDINFWSGQSSGGLNIIGYASDISMIGSGAGANVFGNPSNGYVQNLYLSNELKYNGGMTRNYRVGANSIAQNMGSYVINGIDFGTEFGDQRGLRPNLNGLQGRVTVGAYEMLTYVESDTSVADQSFDGGDIGYDFSYRDSGDYAGRNGWEVNLRQALYLADQGAVVNFTVAQVDKVDIDGNPVYTDQVIGIGNRGQTIYKIAQATDSAGNYLYHDRFDLQYGELNIFNSLTFQVTAGVDPAGKAHGLTINAGGLSRIFNIDGAGFEVPNWTPLTVSIIGSGKTLLLTNGSSSDVGGSIYANGFLTLNNVAISNSRSGSDGGAVYVQGGGLTLNNVSISAAIAAGHGGAVYVEGYVNWNNVTISNTTAGSAGGALYMSGANSVSTFNRVTISNARALNGNGGGICITDSVGDVYFRDVFISGSSAAGAEGSVNVGLGGGIYVSTSGLVQLGGLNSLDDMNQHEAHRLDPNQPDYTPDRSGVTLSGNSAIAGGGIYIAGAGGVSINQASIVNNQATGSAAALGHGGGIYIAGLPGMMINVTNTTVANNTAVNNGGGMYVTGGVLDLTSVTLANNIAGYGREVVIDSDRAYGGGLYFGFGTLSVRNTILAQNLANSTKSVADALASGFKDKSDGHRDDLYMLGSFATEGSGVAVSYSLLGVSGNDAATYRYVDRSTSIVMSDDVSNWAKLGVNTEVSAKNTANGMQSYVVHVSTNGLATQGVNGQGGDPSLLYTLDQLGNVRGNNGINLTTTIGAYQRIQSFYFLTGNGDVTDYRNWVDREGNSAKSDAIFNDEDATFYIGSSGIDQNGNLIYSGQQGYLNGETWTINALASVNITATGSFSVNNDAVLSVGDMMVDGDGKFTIDVKDANITIDNLAFSADSTVEYGLSSQGIFDAVYGNLVIWVAAGATRTAAQNLTAQTSITVKGSGASAGTLSTGSVTTPTLTLENANLNSSGKVTATVIDGNGGRIDANSIEVTGIGTSMTDVTVNAGSAILGNGHDLTFSGSVNVKADTVDVKSPILVDSGSTVLNAANSLSFDSSNAIGVDAGASLRFKVDAAQDITLGAGPASGSGLYFDVEKIRVDAASGALPDGQIYFETGGRINLNPTIAGTAADDIRGIIGFVSDQTMDIGDGSGSTVTFNNALIDYGCSVNLRGDYDAGRGVIFSKQVYVWNDVTVSSSQGRVVITGEVVNAGGTPHSLTIDANEVTLNKVSGLKDLLVSGDNAIRLTGDIEVNGVIDLASNNPIYVIGNASLSGDTLQTNGNGMTGSGNLALNFNPGKVSMIAGIDLGGSLDLRGGTFLIDEIEVQNFTNRANTTIGDAELRGNLTNSGKLTIVDQLTLAGTSRQELLTSDAGGAFLTVGDLVLDNRAGAELLGGTVRVLNDFIFVDGNMGLSAGALRVGGRLIGNSSKNFFESATGDSIGMVYVDATVNREVWLGGRGASEAGVIRFDSDSHQIVGVGGYSPMNTTGGPGGKPLDEPYNTVTRSIVIDSENGTIAVNLDGAYLASEYNRVNTADMDLFANAGGSWSALVRTVDGNYLVSGSNTLAFAVPGFDFAGVRGSYNLTQRELYNRRFILPQINDPGNQYLASREQLNAAWRINPETNPLRPDMLPAGSAMAAPVRLGLLGGETVYSAPLDELLIDGIVLNAEEGRRGISAEQQEAEAQAVWMEIFSNIADRGELQERHPSFRNSVDHALEAFLTA